jgi:hypothetical protein
MLTDPDALARIGFEQGIGFIPFGGIGVWAPAKVERPGSREHQPT